MIWYSIINEEKKIYKNFMIRRKSKKNRKLNENLKIIQIQFRNLNFQKINNKIYYLKKQRDMIRRRKKRN